MNTPDTQGHDARKRQILSTPEARGKGRQVTRAAAASVSIFVK